MMNQIKTKELLDFFKKEFINELKLIKKIKSTSSDKIVLMIKSLGSLKNDSLGGYLLELYIKEHQERVNNTNLEIKKLHL